MLEDLRNQKASEHRQQQRYRDTQDTNRDGIGMDLGEFLAGLQRAITTINEEDDDDDAITMMMMILFLF